MDSLISVLFTAPLYGKAEFRSGMKEDDDTTAPAKSDPPKTPEISAADKTKLNNLAESYNVLQKGLFLVVILACVALYIRMRNKKAKRFPVKSMV